MLGAKTEEPRLRDILGAISIALIMSVAIETGFEESAGIHHER
jgi:hypothetical protein